MTGEQCTKLRAALIGLIGVESVEELQEMEATLRLMPAPDQDKAAMINAIHVLIETAPEKTDE